MSEVSTGKHLSLLCFLRWSRHPSLTFRLEVWQTPWYVTLVAAIGIRSPAQLRLQLLENLQLGLVFRAAVEMGSIENLSAAL